MTKVLLHLAVVMQNKEFIEMCEFSQILCKFINMKKLKTYKQAYQSFLEIAQYLEELFEFVPEHKDFLPSISEFSTTKLCNFISKIYILYFNIEGFSHIE